MGRISKPRIEISVGYVRVPFPHGHFPRYGSKPKDLELVQMGGTHIQGNPVWEFSGLPFEKFRIAGNFVIVCFVYD